MESYLIPASDHQCEQIVKRSQFICYVKHCSGRDAAHHFISTIQERHNDANHNCWAYIAGKPSDPSLWGMNDDGEPKGCAGKPMFNVLQHSGLGEICVVVTRYFGGIKLGTGGMARAYSSTVQQALETLATETKHHYENITIEFPYNLQKTIEKILLEEKSIIKATDYGSQITIDVNIRVEMYDNVLAILKGFQHQGLSMSQTS